MFIDSHELPTGTEIETDLCVIGAGAAGMAIGREFMNSGIKVAVLESGGLYFDPEIQALYEGELSGLRHDPLDLVRLRYFGGSTNHWAGQCRPFFELDFETREGLPYSGWPFGLKDVEPYYLRAATFAQAGSFNYDPDRWLSHPDAPANLFSGDMIVPQITKQSYLDGVSYLDEFERAKDVAIYLFANALEIVTEETATSVTRLRASTLEGPGFTVKAKFYVLATGGIENPRLLLLSNRTQSAGLGNGNDLVGRFFMDHISVTGSKLIVARPELATKFGRDFVIIGDSEIALRPEIPEDVRRREGLLGCTFKFDDELPRHLPGYHSYRHVRENLGRAEMFDDLGYHLRNIVADFDTISAMTYHKMMGETLRNMPEDAADEIDITADMETTANPDSRVTLARERDRLGLNKVHLHWAVDDLVRISARRSFEILAQEVGRLGLGRVKIAVPDEAPWDSHIGKTHRHHIGTTRMHEDPRQGVVDPNCRVHGMSNLYIAGSSVFPTAGAGTVTLLLIALAIRLSDHLKGHFA